MEIIDRLKAQAIEIANEGHNGWGNTMIEAAEKIESLKPQKAPVAEVPCSVGLVGLTPWNIQQIREALTLMNSMILCGEQHTAKSQEKFNEAMEVLWGAN